MSPLRKVKKRKMPLSHPDTVVPPYGAGEDSKIHKGFISITLSFVYLCDFESLWQKNTIQRKLNYLCYKNEKRS